MSAASAPGQDRARLSIACALGAALAFSIVKPGTAAFQWAVLLPALSALAYASLHTMTRSMGLAESAVTMSVYIQLTFIVACSAMGLVFGAPGCSWRCAKRAFSSSRPHRMRQDGVDAERVDTGPRRATPRRPSGVAVQQQACQVRRCGQQRAGGAHAFRISFVWPARPCRPLPSAWLCIYCTKHQSLPSPTRYSDERTRMGRPLLCPPACTVAPPAPGTTRCGGHRPVAAATLAQQ